MCAVLYTAAGARSLTWPVVPPPAVLGPMDPSELGQTLTHEHLVLDFRQAATKPEYGPDNLTDLEMKMENLGKIRHFP